MEKTKSFKLFGAVYNVCKNAENEKGEEQQEVAVESNCSSSSSEMTTLQSYPSIDSVKSVVILSGEDDLEEGGGARDAIWKRKRGESWSEEEHRLFLAGLEKWGSGRWKRIAEDFVRTRSPTQVASHAQKYSLRKAALASNGNRLRRSIFDDAMKSSLGTNSSSARVANRVSPSPEVGPIVHVPCRVVRSGGGKVRLVPLFKRRFFLLTNN